MLNCQRQSASIGERHHNRPQVTPLRRLGYVVLVWIVVATLTTDSSVALEPQGNVAQEDFLDSVKPLLQRYCNECHSKDVTEADIDFGIFSNSSDVGMHLDVWVKVREMLDTQQMPPRGSDQPSDSDRMTFRNRVRVMLQKEAEAQAGDPGPVVLRRLSNSEYTYTVRDLTGLGFLDPAREFPVDGAAGEGFTNVGSGLVMSPSLVQKYLDAAKQIAAHAALFPNEVRFVPFTTERDTTDSLLSQIRAFYGRYTTDGNGAAVDLQGIKFETNQGGVLPLDKYLSATIAHRDALRSGDTTIAAVAKDRGLSEIYLQKLWQALNQESQKEQVLLTPLRDRWKRAGNDDLSGLVEDISRWQTALWKFNTVGHVGREGAPTAWMEAVTPVTARQEFRIPLPAADGSEDVMVRLRCEDLGDGDERDFVLWRDARLEGAGLPSVPLREVRGRHQRRDDLSRELLKDAAAYLAAAGEVEDGGSVSEVAKKNGLNPGLLRVWAGYVFPEARGSVEVNGLLTNQIPKSGDFDFIKGWQASGLPSVIANSSDQEVRVPGIARPHSLMAHPLPDMFVALGWRSPVDGTVTAKLALSDAHPECGNGVAWQLQHRSGSGSLKLQAGEFATSGSAKPETISLDVLKGDLIALLIGPREGNHTCDLTAIDLTITEVDGDKRVWDAAQDCSSDILAGNPHADQHGNSQTWYFFHGAMASFEDDSSSIVTVPSGSLLDQWKHLGDGEQRKQLADRVAKLVCGSPPEPDKAATPDGQLYRQIHQLVLPSDDADLWANVAGDGRFGKHPLGHPADKDHLIVRAPATLEFRIPADMAEGRELVLAGMLEPIHGREGSASVSVDVDGTVGSQPAAQVICAEGSEARQRIIEELANFRTLFPYALCYTKIVPVDEVVTATLFHREDDVFKQLMLTDAEAVELDGLWQDLYYVSEEPLKLVVSLEQIREFSTQDRPEMVEPWDKMKPFVAARAEAFRKQKLASEPQHVASVIEFAERAWRRPLTKANADQLSGLYAELRQDEMSHEKAIRLVIAKVLTSPTFLYRREAAPAGSQPGNVDDFELASRLSYFLWASLPDDELLAAAESGDLAASQGNSKGELINQTRRMLQDAKTRRLAILFACQWLHVRDFDQNDDKNESLYPEFAALRKDMYEETVQFFEDMFRNNRSILEIIDSDHTFLNGPLAKHYGVDGISGEQWQRVNNIRDSRRGGVLAMASFLASQSGASRTSPILRGNWLSETLLGERLPRPPPNIPQLPESVPTGLTARQLIEQHSSDPACAKCHARIDPYGFALEQYDAIGRLRETEVDTKTVLFEGRQIEGIDGLRNYLLDQRRTDFVRQFCRKLLGYALGRSVQLSDEPLIEEMRRRLEADSYRFSAAVETVVLSPQFRQIRGSEFEQ